MQDDERTRLHDELSQQTGRTSDPFASAVRTTRMPMVITDPRQRDNPIVFCNDAFCALTGYERDEIIGNNCRFLQGEATRADDVAKVRRAIASQEPAQVDLLNYRKDGTTFWNALLVSPVFDGDELTFFFASQMDVTDRKRAEEHRFLLNRELDHRVKNTLATVQSVVLQTLRDATVPQHVASAVAGRLQALSRSHDVLTVEAWASADLMDVIKGALEPLHARVGDRIGVEGPPLRIKPRIATMLSLAMHEMGDNAARYGSLSVPGGTVDIKWAITDGEIRLNWTENDGPPVSPPSRQGYGTRIIERVVAAEFEATVSLHFPPEGVRLTVVAPTDRIGQEATEWRMVSKD
ncbi:signal transduction histidine kinase [Aureimonas endophytica]|uniref:Blue-light-activated histidine kinase n=1 Tax=Aureimonas endophytica TaxID=2027858 RepID=A0A916ZFU7_9HYPH|nr:HWE histidine kinase domain-containing protein [Aureimonas endophytica]GGD93448.1 signal transduction histidine kinase [Aureimonas endophytica]